MTPSKVISAWLILTQGFFAQPVQAEVEYLYSGNVFDRFSRENASVCATLDPEFTSYTSSDFVQMSLKPDQPLANNLQLFDVRSLPGFSITLRDGQQEMIAPSEVLMSTDENGDVFVPWSVISNWCLFPSNGISTLNRPDGLGVNDQAVLSEPSGGIPDTPRDMGPVSPIPGAWTRVGALTPTFNDVPLNHWAGSFIEILAESGTTAGCGSGNFCPGDVVTQAQMAVFLVRTFGL